MAATNIGQAYRDRVEVRGRDLAGDLMGRLTFTEYFHLLLTGREPTEDQRFFLDLLLVAIAEHGMMPTNVAARMTLAADPESLHGAVAAGILGCGPVILGTAEPCARLLEAAQERVASGGSAAGVAEELAREIHDAGARLPGFAHPVHRPVDPRAERILELEVSGPHVLLARAFRDAAAQAWGRPLTMNVSMPIAAVMLDLAFSPDAVKSVPILARTAGLLAHLAEERRHPLGFVMAARAEEVADYEHGPEAEPERRSRRRPRPAPGRISWRPTMRPIAARSRTCSSARASTARGWRRPASPPPTTPAGSPRSPSCRSPTSESSRQRARPTTRSASTSASRARTSFGSIRRAAPPARRATSR